MNRQIKHWNKVLRWNYDDEDDDDDDDISNNN